MIEHFHVLHNSEIRTNLYDNHENYRRVRIGSIREAVGLIHLNIRSLPKHFDKLLIYIESEKILLNIIIKEKQLS